MRIREASDTDADTLAMLLTQLGYPALAADVRARLTRLAITGRATALVAEHQGAVVGVITCHLFDSIHATAPVAWLTTLAVDDAHHGSGIGRALVGAAEAWAAANGAERVSVSSGLQREEAHAFYQRLGYARSGVRFTRTLTPGSPATS